METPLVLVLAPDPFGTGGIERVTRSLLEALAELYGGERVGLLPLRRRATRKSEVRLLHAGTLRESSSGRVPAWAQAMYTVRALRAARRRRHRQLAIVAGHPSLAPVAHVAARISGARFAVWCHGKEAWGRLSVPVRGSLRAADCVFTHAAFTARQVERNAGLPANSVRVINPCLPSGLGDVAPDHKGDQRVITVARLSPADSYKGVDSLLLAWPAIASRAPDAELVVIGDGADRGRLESIARVLDAPNVRFLGRVPDEKLREIYSSATAFALPSRHAVSPRPYGEGFGLVFLEAGAAGLPVVAGRGGGVDEVVEHGVNGLLIDPENRTELVDAVVALLEDTDLSRALGEAGRRRAAERFGYPRFRDDIQSLIASILGS